MGKTTVRNKLKVVFLIKNRLTYVIFTQNILWFKINVLPLRRNFNTSRI